jgi:plasmid stability protein
MPTVTIRNVEPEVLEVWKRRARDNGRSLEAELHAVLANGVRGPSPAGLIAVADRIAALTPPVEQTDSTGMIRRNRDGLIAIAEQIAASLPLQTTDNTDMIRKNRDRG